MVRNRNSHWRCSVREGVLRNFAKFLEKHLCQSQTPVFFIKYAGLREKETLTCVFSSGFCGIFRKHFLQNTSGRLLLRNKLLELIKRRSKVKETIMSCERALNFDQ